MTDKHVLETVVKLAGAVDPSLGKSAQKAAKALNGLNVKALAMNTAIAGGAILAVKACFDIGKALYNLGSQFDKAYDTIRINTGATGKELEALKGNLKNVYSSTSASMEDAGKVIGDYNTRLGLTGSNLEDLSKQALAVSSMMKEDLGTTVQASSQAFQQWNISADQMGNKMDYIFKVAQSTGIGFNQLMGNMKAVGPAMQQLGFSFEESAAMMGQMEKAGINTDIALKAMQKSVGVFAKDGLDASKGFEVYAKAIKNATSETKAIELASEVFGSKAGSQMAAAIRKGALSVEAFAASMAGSTETIMGAMWDTADAPEKMQILQHKFQTAIEPLASTFYDSIGKIMPSLFKIFDQLSPILEDFAKIATPLVNDVFEVIAEVMESTAPLFGQLAKAIFPLLSTVIKELMPPLVEIVRALLPATIDLVAALSPILVLIAKGISANLTGTIKALAPIIVDVMNVISNLINFLTNVFPGQWQAAWENIVEIVKNLFKGLGDILKAPFEAVKSGIDSLKGNFKKGNQSDNTEELPKFAKGGFTSGMSIAGEDGTEAVISFNPAYRDRNIATWLKAGELLGLGSTSNSNSYYLGGFTWSPTIVFREEVDANGIMNRLRGAADEFGDFILERLQENEAGSYRPRTSKY